MTVVIENWLPEPIANGSHGHWSVKAAKLKDAQQMAYVHARAAAWEPLTCRARLGITLVFPTKRRRDYDNLYARCKGCIDGIKSFVVDDSTDWLELTVRAEVQKGRKATILELEAA